MGKRKSIEGKGDSSSITQNSDMKLSYPRKNAISNEKAQAALKDARQIIAQAYQEAARIVDEASQKARQITGEDTDWDIATYKLLSNLAKPGKLTVHSYEQIDELFIQMRSCLTKITKNDRQTTEELTELVSQVEYWVESLVIETLKLASLERWLRGVTEFAKGLQEKLDSE